MFCFAQDASRGARSRESRLHPFPGLTLYKTNDPMFSFVYILCYGFLQEHFC